MAHWTIQPSRAVGYVELRLSPAADNARELIEICLMPNQAAALGRELAEIAGTFRETAEGWV